MASAQWYYARDNQQLGPVSANELKQLADGGQLGPDDLVWREGLAEWTAAKKVKGLFDAGTPAGAQSAAPESAPQVSPEPASQAAPEPVPQVAPEASAPIPSEKPTVGAEFGEAPSTDPERPPQRAPRGLGRHLFDVLLEGVRTRLTAQFVEATLRLFTLAGYYGLFVAMVVLLVFDLILGVKTREFTGILIGLAGIVVLVVLQYTARRFCTALERLNRSVSVKMASTAFLDCVALLNIFGGVAALIGLALFGVQTGEFFLAVPAVAAFVLCQSAAVIAVNPKTLNVSISPDARAGEELIGILSFLVKFSARMSPVAFGTGVVWGTIAMLYACLLAMFPPEAPEPASPVMGGQSFGGLLGGGDLTAGLGGGDLTELLEATGMSAGKTDELTPARRTASRASTMLYVFAALPLIMYFFFLSYYLFLDVLLAVLSIPRKLDKLAVGRGAADAAGAEESEEEAD